MTDVNIFLTHDVDGGTTQAPSKGSLRWTPSYRRTIVGDPDEVVLPQPFNAPLHLGAGVAHPDANDPDIWFWIVDELVRGGTTGRCLNVPAGGPVDYADLVEVVPVPAGDVAAAKQSSLNTEIELRTAGDEDLQEQFDNLAQVARTGSYDDLTGKPTSNDPRKPAKYIDTIAGFFGPTGYRWATGQRTTPTTTTAATLAGATVIPVADATGITTGVPLLLLGGTANQKVAVVQSVAGLNVTLTTPMPTAIPSASVVAPVWADSVHLTDAGYAGIAYAIANAKNADGTDHFHLAAGERVTFLGNSWFQQARDNPPDEFAAAITTKFPGALVTNAGVGGDRGPDLIARFSTAVPAGTKYVVFNEPGGNSLGVYTMPAIVRQLATLVRMCQAIGACAVYTGTAPLPGLATTSAAMIGDLLADGYSMAAADAILAYTDQLSTTWYP